MPKVPQINKPMPPKRNTTIICVRGGAKLTAQDQAELEKYMEFRKNRAKKAAR